MPFILFYSVQPHLYMMVVQCYFNILMQESGNGFGRKLDENLDNLVLIKLNNRINLKS